uniref:Uncharacterized protein n=1 Tax=Arundo donax TaxID=35708 RepID=A0A0A8ZY76_ARUDO
MCLFHASTTRTKFPGKCAHHP